jgi:hypothetical protein
MAAMGTGSLQLAERPLLTAAEVATIGAPVSRLVSPDGRRIAYGQIAVAAGGQQRVRIIVGDADGANRRALPVDAESVDEVQWYGYDRIAYVTDHGQDGYLLMDLEGQAAGRLTMPAGCDSFFHQCLSPNGKYIAYCGNYFETDQTFDGDKDRRQFLKDHPDVKPLRGLFVVDLEQQTVKQLLDQTVANLPSWSPDSKLLACGIGHYVKDYPLAIVDVAAGKAHRPDVKGVAAGWSPDAARLCITTDVVRGGSWLGGIPLDGALAVFDAARFLKDGSIGVERASGPGTNVYVEEPRAWSISGCYGGVWSPDGKWIAYRRHEADEGEGREKSVRREVWIARPDGSDARKVLTHGARELAWVDGRTLVWVDEGRFGRFDVEIDGAAAAGPTPRSPPGRFTLVGRVVDGQGQPLSGVEVSVATGIATLFRGAPVTTGPDGRYELHFGPGAWIDGGGPNLQAASVYATKPGYYERDLCRGGNLGMANFRPAGDDADGGWNFAGVVYPGHPYELDFVMLSAAQVAIELVDASGKPLEGFKVRMGGEDLYPSSSILQSATTDAAGAARFENVPLKRFWFSLGAGRAEYKTPTVSISEEGELRFRLIYDDLAGDFTAEAR